MAIDGSLARGLARRSVKTLEAQMTMGMQDPPMGSTKKRPSHRLRQNTETIRSRFGSNYVGMCELDASEPLRVLFSWDTTVPKADGPPRLMLVTFPISRVTGNPVSKPLGRLIVTEHAAQRVIQRSTSLDWREPMRELRDVLVFSWVLANRYGDSAEFAMGSPHGSALVVVEVPPLLVSVVSWLPRERLRPEQIAAEEPYPVPDDLRLASGRKEFTLAPAWNVPE